MPSIPECSPACQPVRNKNSFFFSAIFFFSPKPCNLSHSAAYLIIALLIISIYHTMSNHVIPCYTMLYHVIPSHTMFYHVIPLPILFLQFHPFPPKPCKLSHSPADLILAQFDLFLLLQTLCCVSRLTRRLSDMR